MNGHAGFILTLCTAGLSAYLGASVPALCQTQSQETLTPSSALRNLRDASVVQGDQLGNVTPIADPINITQFLVLLQRSLCVNAHTANLKTPWYSSALRAVGRAIPVPQVDPYPEGGWLISRQDAALYAYDVIVYARLPIAQTPANAPPFADEAQIRPNARFAVTSVVYADLMSTERNWFRPTRPLTAGDAYLLSWKLVVRRRAATQKQGGEPCVLEP